MEPYAVLALAATVHSVPTYLVALIHTAQQTCPLIPRQRLRSAMFGFT